MTCPLCGERKAKRACPALGKQICAICCGTKRLVQIHCPSDCAYLAVAREHPPAAQIRQQQRDIGILVQFMRDLNRSQSELFFLVCRFLLQYQPDALHAVIDDDVVEASRSLASTLETASRGVIYEHRPASLAAERLAGALKPLLAEAGKGGGSAFERDAAVVFRRIETAVNATRQNDSANARAFLDVLTRVLRTDDPEHPAPGGDEAQEQRLIVP